MDKEIIRRIIRRHIQEVKYCYERELTKKPGLRGTIVVDFTIGQTGQIIASTLRGSSLGSPLVETCVVRAVLGWQFPVPLHGAIVFVSYPFGLRPAGDGASGNGGGAGGAGGGG
ncbi:MAG TPA: AgmX/PglI C-terminal domain-containing protein [Polyangia bacterium]